jgi:hypothetical protein
MMSTSTAALSDGSTGVSIVELEDAINYFRELHSHDGERLVLCDAARQLANVYAILIFERRTSVDLATLNDSQRAVMGAYYSAVRTSDIDNDQVEVDSPRLA